MYNGEEMARYEDVGRREYGQRIVRERWFHCAILDEVIRESDTTIEQNPASRYFGMRVCFKHKDEPSYADQVIWNPPHPGDDERNW